MPSDLQERLRALYRRAAPIEERVEERLEHQQTHEDALVAALGRRGGGASVAQGRGWRGRWPRLPRLAIAGALGVAVAVGACAMPAEYPVRLGYGFEITVDPAHIGGVEQLDPDGIARWLHEQGQVERVELMVAHHRRESTAPDGMPAVHDELTLRMFVAGDALDRDALVDDLRDRFPVLADAELRDAPLSGMVHGTLGGKLSHDLLDLTLDRHGVEEAERQILEQLRADGIDLEHATIDITHEEGADGSRRIEVRVEAEPPG